MFTKIFNTFVFTATILLFLGGIHSNVQAQDTSFVQTFTFNDITKRRGWFKFPDKNKTYSKILMYYTLKCDAQTTQDGYDCGEWDYLTYNMVYDYNATYDSTYTSTKWFNLGASSTPDKQGITTKPTYEFYKKYLYSIQHDTVYSYDSAIVGKNTLDDNFPFDKSVDSRRTQYIWDTTELLAAGLQSGDITGIRFYITQTGNISNNLKIRMAHVDIDSFDGHLVQTGWTTVYQNNLKFQDTGWQDIQFYQNFNWNGSQNILIDISYSDSKGNDDLIKAATTNPLKGLSVSDKSKVMNFNGSGDRIYCGTYDDLTDAQPKTIELWAKTDAFNKGGLFAVGQRSTTRADFSLRTTTTNNEFRVQLWGDDVDVSLDNSLGTWHHFALTYDGSTVTLYYDGEKVAEKTVTLVTGNSEIEIGSWNGNYFIGQIDEVRIWNKAIDQATIKAWMTQSLQISHPDYSKLLAYYDFENEGGSIALNKAPNGHPGEIQGNAWWKDISQEDFFFKPVSLQTRPQIIFEQGHYYSSKDSTLVMDSMLNTPVRIFFRNNPSGLYVINDSASNHPTEITDTVIAYQADYWQYISNPVTGDIIDSVYIAAEQSYQNKTLEWYSNLVVYEIGRFITPYGIGLSLGDDGYTWVYDVTDYAGLLHDSVELAAGNQQELIDLRFVMIEGTPARNVLNINHIWEDGHPSYKYKDLDDDTKCPPKTIGIHKDAKSLKIKTRLSGHGHNSDDGNYPHCCEWKDNTHYIYIDNQKIDEWHIWREDCDMNPIFPQGGTWNGSREGWCPGDLVPEHETDISSFINKDSITIDYRITPVPSDNQGMGNGNYIFAMHVFEYGQANYNLDAEIYNVIRPSNVGVYSRENPICYDPAIILRNGGSQTLTKVEFEFGVNENNMATYTWEGSLEYMETEEVTLPIPDINFWKTNQNEFIFRITKTNGSADENIQNNEYRLKFDIPDTYEDPFVIYLKTNNVPDENAYEIRDIYGNLVASRKNMTANTLYKDTIDLPKGCYTFEFFDEGYGLYYWAWTAQGTGSLYFRELGGQVLKKFEPDFGEKIFYPFTIGFPLDIESPNLESLIEVYPNPAKDKLNLEIMGLNGTYKLQLIDFQGRLVKSQDIVVDENYIQSINVSHLSKGLYFIKIFNSSKEFTEKVIIE